MKKYIFFVFITHKNGIDSVYSDIKCPKSGIFTAWSRVIMQVKHSSFSGRVEKFCGQRWLSPLEKLARTPMTVNIGAY